MRSFIKKDLLLFWRDRKEVITILLLPMLLVFVFNFAFSNIFSSNPETATQMRLAIVQQDDEQLALSELAVRLQQEAGLSEAAANQWAEQASGHLPVRAFLQFLNSDELQQVVSVHELQEAEAAEQVRAGELDGMLIVPAGFTADSLFAAYTNEPVASSLVLKMDKDDVSNNSLHSLLAGYFETLNYQFALQQSSSAALLEEVALPAGGVEQVGAGNSFSLTQYFVMSTGALFTLFMAASIATKTGAEIRQQVLQRIVLTNSHPMNFLAGKMTTTFILTGLQMAIVFVQSNLILKVFSDRSLVFWSGQLVIIGLLALGISGLSAVFTAISLCMANTDAANGVFMLNTYST